MWWAGNSRMFKNHEAGQQGGSQATKGLVSSHPPTATNPIQHCPVSVNLMQG